MTPGLVSIVGAGPGDPELLTVRALARLQSADLVVHDGLVPDAILACAADATRLSASRRAGEDGPPPEDVAAVLVDASRAGQRVVRLRAGDPFVLARGAEEMLALADAGVPFEIVPGLTTASAAATLAGIPLTHRGTSSAFLVTSGHAKSTYGPILRALVPGSVTVVVLMGLAARERIADLLIERGWPAATPAAVMTNAARRGARTWYGSIGGLGEPAAAPERGAPGVIVIGDVVEIGQRSQQTWQPVTTQRHSDARV